MAHNRSVRRTLIGIALLLAIFIGAVIMSFDSRRRGTDIPVGQLFEALVARPVPAEVRDLQGGGTTWQGYSIYLRFRAPSLEAAGFQSPPFESADCERVARGMLLPESLDSPFAPAWAPSVETDAQCLQLHELTNEWTHLGTHRVLFSGGWVHFAGFGA